MVPKHEDPSILTLNFSNPFADRKPRLDLKPQT